jgi:hypothetical protein
MERDYPYEYDWQRRGGSRGAWRPRDEFRSTAGEPPGSGGEYAYTRGRGEPYRADEPPYYGTRFARGYEASWGDRPRRGYEVDEGERDAERARERAHGLIGWLRERIRATAGWAAARLRLGGDRLGQAVREGGARMGAGAERFGSALRETGEVTGYALGRGGERLGENLRVLGRVPKGYKRSDDRILDDVCERLARSWVDAREVEVQVRAGDVILTGRVPSKEHKHAIEDLAENVFGVVEVQNHLRVARPVEPGGRDEPPTRELGDATSGAGLVTGPRGESSSSALVTPDPLETRVITGPLESGTSRTGSTGTPGTSPNPTH